MSPWINLSPEAAAQHPRFGIKGLAAVLRAMLVITPSLWLLGSISDLQQIIEVRLNLKTADFILVVPKIVFFLWSGWNAHLLGKHDRRFFLSLFSFFAIGPVIIIASSLLWLSQSGLQVNIKVVAEGFITFLAGWAFWSAIIVAYIQLSRRINVTLRNRVRANDSTVNQSK